MSRLGGLPSVYALDSAQKEIKALSAEFPPDYWGSLVAWAKRTFKRGPLLGASTNGPHFRIVGQAGKATHWRTFIARWKVEKGWSIDASGITTPDVRLAIDSMSSLSLQYGDDAGGAGGVPDREARQYADHWDRGALPAPTITVAIPVKRSTRERGTRETAAKKGHRPLTIAALGISRAVMNCGESGTMPTSQGSLPTGGFAWSVAIITP